MNSVLAEDPSASPRSPCRAEIMGGRVKPGHDDQEEKAALRRDANPPAR